MKSILTCFKKYATFSGRARRREFWLFFLFLCLVSIILSSGYLGNFFSGFSALDFAGDPNELSLQINQLSSDVKSNPLYLVSNLFGLATLVPFFAVTSRRLHDTGRSFWYIFIFFIPVAGPIWLLVLLFLNSKPGDNEYGPNPKGIGNNY